QDTYAVLIVDEEQKLTGVVTSYDATEYFRQRAEDMMLVEDIEEALKRYILLAFPAAEDGTNVELTKAIEDIMPSNRDLHGKFQQALLHYISNTDINNHKLQKALLDQAFKQHIYLKEAARPFDKLTLNQYIDLFLHESRWSRYSSIFSLDRKNIRKLLDDVRKIRNNLAHFRSTVSKQQHSMLLACKNWLERHEEDVLNEFEPKQLTAVQNINAMAESFDDSFAPIDESLQASESRYALLAQFLQSLPMRAQQIKMAFQQIEDIIGGDLPPSARQHRSWWANDSVSHIQSQQWLDVDWRVSRINMSEEEVIFTRIKEREKAYIDFFSALIQGMRAKSLFYKRRPSPDGSSWLTFASIPEAGEPITSLVFSFARYGRFRVELYIDTKDKERNKQIFDALYARRQAIQEELGEMGDALQWERIDDRRASRIALYHAGAIVDKDDKLVVLRKWALEAMSRFLPVMEKYVTEVLKS
ncbi:MAG: DUF4268 domain-containing protein, partial [Ktedonobacteraceae bacterium]|nr:DUF4268 domain-containing protein [Ktedonobacteraceae bacterium]